MWMRHQRGTIAGIFIIHPHQGKRTLHYNTLPPITSHYHQFSNVKVEYYMFGKSIHPLSTTARPLGGHMDPIAADFGCTLDRSAAHLRGTFWRTSDRNANVICRAERCKNTSFLFEDKEDKRLRNNAERTNIGTRCIMLFSEYCIGKRRCSSLHPASSFRLKAGKIFWAKYNVSSV